MLFAGVDVKNMEEVVVKYVVETELDGEEERWEEEMWGFEDELSEKMFNEDIFIFSFGTSGSLNSSIALFTSFL